MATSSEQQHEAELEAPPPVAEPKAKMLKKPQLPKEDPPAAISVAKDPEADAEIDLDKDETPGSKYQRERAALPKHLQDLQTADHLALKEWIQQLAAEAPIRVVVHRKEPKYVSDPVTGDRKKCDGQVATYDRTIDEEEIQELHGGGQYQLIIKTRGPKGGWIYFGARSINIAGDPRIDDVPRARPLIPQQATSPTSDPLTQSLLGKSFDFMARAATEGGRSSSGVDVSAAVAAAIAPFKVQLETLSRIIENKDRELAAVRESASKGDPYKDKLLDKMIDSDSARINALRTQHESELRMLKEQQVASESRIRDQHQRDLDRMERSHEREISSLKSSYDTQKSALESSQATQKMVLDAEIKRLEREVSDLKTEIAALRAKKDQTVGEKIKEMKDLKELLGDESDDEDEDKSTILKVIEAAGQLPVVEALAQRLGGAPQAQQVAAQVQPPTVPPKPRKLIRDKRTGAVLAPGPDGTMVQVKKIVPPPDGNAQVAVPPVDPATIKMAIEYMEGAYRAGTDPEAFAESARPMIPSSVLGAIRALGIDEFMAKVAQLDGTSPLATQGGRNWRRRVANKLLGEADE